MPFRQLDSGENLRFRGFMATRFAGYGMLSNFGANVALDCLRVCRSNVSSPLVARRLFGRFGRAALAPWGLGGRISPFAVSALSRQLLGLPVWATRFAGYGAIWPVGGKPPSRIALRIIAYNSSYPVVLRRSFSAPCPYRFRFRGDRVSPFAFSARLRQRLGLSVGATRFAGYGTFWPVGVKPPA
jgi:hypothetical protein